MENDLSPDLVRIEFTLQLKSGQVRSVIPVPAEDVTITDLLPILQNFTDRVTQHMQGSAAQDGTPVTCGPKCGSCCRQLVPLSPFEAEALARWVRSLPEEQQRSLAQRFLDAMRALEQSEVLPKLNPEMFDLEKDEFRLLGTEYFRAQVPCPFLIDESCSIHPIRPLVCREYMVVSPPEYCAEPGHARVQGVGLPIQPSRALIKLGRRVDGDAQGWLPLVFLFHWIAAKRQAGRYVAGPGPAVMREFVEALST